VKTRPSPVRFELDELRRRLQEAEETLDAIRSGEVDALVVNGPEGERVFTLKGAEHPYRVMVESMNEGAISFALDGIILYCNSAFARMVNVPLDQLMGHRLVEFVPPAEVASLTELIKRGHSHPTRGEISLASSSGELPAQISLNPVEMDDEQVIGVVITDLSERRGREQAQEAVRLRDEFLSIASHELRTPLSTLVLHLGMGERLLGKSDLPRLEQSLRKAKDQAQRMTELINRLLDVTRIASGKLELEVAPHDLGDLVREIVDSLTEEANKVVCEIRLSIEDGLVMLCDRSRLQQTIVNVISNALKYAPGQPIAITLERRGGEAVLNVDDRGAGIDPADLGRIFNRFERASSSPQAGLGLGLYIAREIVVNMADRYAPSVGAAAARASVSSFPCHISPSLNKSR
jgi:PAS domain S-box-containing protein